MRLQDRAQNYNKTFPEFSKVAPLYASDRWIIGTWIIGNCYTSKFNYYGEYPHKYLNRILSLFPDIPEENTLHLFSGVSEYGITLDINPNLKPQIIGDVHQLSELIPKKYKIQLILADPPYSEEDALHYGSPMIKRNKVVKECYKILDNNGFLVWLDQVYPMYNKTEFLLIGAIGLIQSTNHRVRMIFIYQKQEKE